MTIQEQYLQAKEIKDALRGGYAPGEGSPGLSSKIMPDSAACNRRRELLREVLQSVGLERTLILIHATPTIGRGSTATLRRSLNSRTRCGGAVAGMSKTLRDEFAMAALTGISSNVQVVQVVQEAMMYAAALQDPTIPSPDQFTMMAMWAYKQADAMMELRNP